MIEMQNTTVETLLEQHLRPVAAPVELWDRVRNPSAPQKRTAPGKLAWALAALVVFAGAVSSLKTPSSFAASETAALQALARGTGDLEFQSAKAAEIRAWVRTRTGLDVPLVHSPAGAVQLLGASVADSGTVEITYRIGDHPAALMVSKAKRNFFDGGAHGRMRRESLETAQTYSWTFNDRRYTLACASPGELEAACSLCHVNLQWQTALN
jgi:hypothetical protein